MIDPHLARIEYLRAKVERLTEDVLHWRAVAMSTHGELAKENDRLRDEVKRLRNRCAQDERLLSRQSDERSRPE